MPETITYGAIESALITLGFDVTVGPDYRLYRHAPTDTVIATPDFPPERGAEEMRLATVRRMVVERGVARRDRLERLLRDAPPVPGPDRLERLLRDAPPVPGPVAVKRSTVRITHDVPDEVKA